MPGRDGWCEQGRAWIIERDRIPSTHSLYSRNRGINDSCYYCSPFWPGMRVNDYSGDDEENHATNNWPRVAGAGHRLCGCCGGDRIGHRQQRQQFPGSHPTTLFRWVQGSRYYISSVGLSVFLSDYLSVVLGEEGCHRGTDGDTGWLAEVLTVIDGTSWGPNVL